MIRKGGDGGGDRRGLLVGRAPHCGRGRVGRGEASGKAREQETGREGAGGEGRGMGEGTMKGERAYPPTHPQQTSWLQVAAGRCELGGSAHVVGDTQGARRTPMRLGSGRDTCHTCRPGGDLRLSWWVVTLVARGVLHTAVWNGGVHMAPL